jgi:phage-related tail fiber protein
VNSGAISGFDCISNSLEPQQLGTFKFKHSAQWRSSNFTNEENPTVIKKKYSQTYDPVFLKY